MLGLTPVEPLPGQLLQSGLPLQVAGRSIAAIGLNLFYVVQSYRIETSRVGDSGDPLILVDAGRCQAINQLAAAGHMLAYVVTAPAGPSAAIGGCGAPGVVSWSIWLLDLNGGRPRQVAAGTRLPDSIDAAEYPTHVAISDSAYAFDREADAKAHAKGSIVEVHSLDGRLLWTSQSPAPVANVMLGGNRLAVTTEAGAAAGPMVLWIADAAHPTPDQTAMPASSASMSLDGSWVVWDLQPYLPTPAGTHRSAVGIEALDSGRITSLNAVTGSDVAAPIRPSISLTRAGPAIAWFATAPGGAVYPAFRFAGGGDGGILESVQQPVWLEVQGSSLIWVAASPDGWSTTAYAVDLLTLASG